MAPAVFERQRKPFRYGKSTHPQASKLARFDVGFAFARSIPAVLAPCKAALPDIPKSPRQGVRS